MEKPICKDVMLLSMKAEAATEDDRQIITDLKDTLKAHRSECVGMAANMIGVPKKIIVVAVGPTDLVMVNPVITAASGEYEADEGCLSLMGTRKAQRYQNITVVYRDEDFNKRIQQFSGWIAQIIQHEYDHLEGVLI